jgi:DNA-binding NarL/FixJ family response regulator
MTPVPSVRVLICDDAVLYGTLLTHWFKDDRDIEVVGRVSSGREAVELGPGLRPDVIVLDHMLPDGLSIELAPRLRASLPGVAIVLISGLTEDALREAAEAIGAQAAVTKASTQEALRAAILSVGESRIR